MTRIHISEVGPRDGLQNISRVMPLEAKKAWIAAEAAAGVPEIEVGSFVPPSLLPQMADTAELVAFAKGIEGLAVAVLVPNFKGAERAIAAGSQKMSLPFSMSETHSLKNVRKDHTVVLAEIRAIAELVTAQPQAMRPHFEVGLATAFGCTIEGPVDEDNVVRLAAAAMEAGAAEVGLSDTTGYANPAQVKRLVRRVKGEVGADRLNTLHLHNTRGLGLANALAGLEEGITTLDASLGGLGGCPFAPGASGNIVTEDLIFMLEAMGCQTGVDLEKLMKVRSIIAEALSGEPLYGFIPDAGLPLGFAQVAA
ncbi:hydroxymethylglutaryl-CoA lyase [Sphingobium estronivorans]|uniref:hydroxymethylglutaryl-CoA lyase n=1 Tax=Sphingobium estronivorans TaxID=1577690 RepID=UPI00123C2568|nr:hydroxymethylglutaryl-CoA lyase [Sphingobium estronivorans]